MARPISAQSQDLVSCVRKMEMFWFQVFNPEVNRLLEIGSETVSDLIVFTLQKPERWRPALFYVFIYAKMNISIDFYGAIRAITQIHFSVPKVAIKGYFTV